MVLERGLFLCLELFSCGRFGAARPVHKTALQSVPPKGDVAQRQGDTLKGRRVGFDQT